MADDFVKEIRFNEMDFLMRISFFPLDCLRAPVAMSSHAANLADSESPAEAPGQAFQSRRRTKIAKKRSPKDAECWQTSLATEKLHRKKRSPPSRPPHRPIERTDLALQTFGKLFFCLGDN